MGLRSLKARFQPVTYGEHFKFYEGPNGEMIRLGFEHAPEMAPRNWGRIDFLIEGRAWPTKTQNEVYKHLKSLGYLSDGRQDPDFIRVQNCTWDVDLQRKWMQEGRINRRYDPSY